MSGNRIVLLVVLLIVLLGAGYFLTNPEVGRQVLVDLGMAESEPGQYLTSGMLEAQVFSLSAEDGGRVDALLAEVGEKVKAGQALIFMDTDLLEAQIRIARAEVSAAQATLDMLQAGPRQVDLAVAQAVIEQAQTALEGARQAVEDAREISPEAVRDEQVALAEAAVDSAKANLDIAETALHRLQEGAPQEEGDVARAALDAVQAQLADLESKLSARSITSPIDGVVLEHLLLPGELALPGWPILTVADLSELELTVYIPEADLNWVQMGQNVKVKVDAYPDKEFDGEVVFIADQAEFTPRNVQTPDERVILVYAVKIRVPNPNGILKSGLPADAVFEVQP